MTPDKMIERMESWPGVGGAGVEYFREGGQFVLRLDVLMKDRSAHTLERPVSGAELDRVSSAVTLWMQTQEEALRQLEGLVRGSTSGSQSAPKFSGD
jgi:hypothetical protein